MVKWLRGVRTVLLLSAIAGAVWSVLQWRRPAPLPERSMSKAISLRALAPFPDDTGWASSIDVVAERLPFDDPAEPSTVPDGESQPIAVVQPPASPAYALSGVVVGSVSQALLSGIAGQERSIALRIGDRVGGVQLLQVDSAGATIDANGERRRLLLPASMERR